MIAGLKDVKDRLSQADGEQLRPADRASEAIFQLMGK
jgi:hypothetical protein